MNILSFANFHFKIYRILREEWNFPFKFLFTYLIDIYLQHFITREI
jgi:hypothetical protein